VKAGIVSKWLLAAILLPGMLCAQAVAPQAGRLRGPAWWESAWWSGPLVRDIDLTEAQRNEIRNTVREYRGHLLELREAAQRTDDDLDALLNASPLDQRKAAEAIDRLANARAELTRTLSQMTLRLRSILTDEQWQLLQQRAEERRSRRRGPPPGANTYKSR
jgi:Spy/CpxP family protein refolding chaperone